MSIFKKIIAILTVGLIVYLIGSLLAWSINPDDWGGFLRFIILLFYVPFIIKVISD